MSDSTAGNGGPGCLTIALVVVLVLWALGFFNARPAPPDHPTLVGAAGGGPGAAVAGGWHR